MSDLTSKKKLRDFAETLTGVRPTARSLRGIVDEMIANYEAAENENNTETEEQAES